MSFPGKKGEEKNWPGTANEKPRRRPLAENAKEGERRRGFPSLEERGGRRGDIVCDSLKRGVVDSFSVVSPMKGKKKTGEKP